MTLLVTIRHSSGHGLTLVDVVSTDETTVKFTALASDVTVDDHRDAESLAARNALRLVRRLAGALRGTAQERITLAEAHKLILEAAGPDPFG